MTPKRIAYLSGAVRVTTREDADTGGPRSHVLGVVGAFERAGWDVERYIAGDQAWARRLAGAGREAVVQKARWRAVVADGLRLATGRYSAVAAPRSISEPVALAYERFGSFQSLGRAFQRRGVPWVLETSGPFFHEARVERGTLALTALAKRTELGAYRACDLLVCVSEPLRDWIVAAGVPGERTFVMPNGVDVSWFDPATVADAPKADALLVGFVGTLLAWQGVDTLVDAVAVARARGVDVAAVVVGDGPERLSLQRLSRDRGVGDAVTFTGQVPAREIPAHIASFDVGFSGHLPLLGGRMYHSPLKLYEYLAMGRPIVAADHPEARSLVERSGAGHLFPPGDVDYLAGVLEQLAADIPSIRARAASIRSHAVTEHSWDRRVADLLAELDRRGL